MSTSTPTAAVPARPAARIWRLVSTVAIAALVGIAVWAAVLSSPLGGTALEIQLSSTRAGFSQLFWPESGTYSESRSSGQAVSPGDNQLTLSLGTGRSDVSGPPRWDPLNAPATLVVRSMSIRSAFVEEPVPLSSLRPSVDISEIAQTGSGAEFTTLSNDPQALIDYDVVPVVDRSRRGAEAVAVLAGVVAGAIILAAVLRKGRPDRSSPASASAGLRFTRITGAAVLTVAAVLLIAWAGVLR